MPASSDIFIASFLVHKRTTNVSHPNSLVIKKDANTLKTSLYPIGMFFNVIWHESMSAYPIRRKKGHLSKPEFGCVPEMINHRLQNRASKITFYVSRFFQSRFQKSLVQRRLFRN